ncbi:TBC1 domain family member 31 [Lycorma delicatula]|uniref:TBC1 domain family member 31 n=1 Tax=Lycorma delicatula TaxID=130591 RepID=UPI003F512477
MNSHIHKQSFQIKSSRKDGLLVQIHNTVTNHKGKKKCLRFVNASFSDTYEQIAASDQVGNVFIIDLLSLKFWMLPCTGYCSTLVYSTYRKNELLIGKDNGDVESVNIELCEITGRLIGHKLAVKWISFHQRYTYCLTGTTDEAFIWNLQTNTQIHQITLYKTVKLKQVTFIPVSNNILACFENDTIQAWKFGTFESIIQISPDIWKNHRLNAIAFSKNGCTLVVGGQASMLFVINLQDWVIKCTLNLPEKCIGTKHLEFLSQPYDGGNNNILLALTITCTVYFINVSTSDILYNFSLTRVCIDKLICSGNSKYTVFILDTGELNIYSTEKLFPNLTSGFLSNDKEKHESKSNVTESKKNFHEKCVIEYSDKLKKQLSKVDSHISNKQSSLKSTVTRELLQNQLQNEISCLLNVERLRPILKEFGEYPECYRLVIWKNILALPMNRSAFNALISKGFHIVSESVGKAYPLENKHLLSSLKRSMSCLAYWSPLFSQVSYLPEVVFPFVKVFKNDPLACFEAVITIIVNWCQRWFEFFPFPPVNVLSLIENVLSEWDEELFLWFNDHHITAHTYGWALLENMFSEVLTSHQWLQLFDNILSNEPSFIIFAVVSYNVLCRSALLKLSNISDFETFYHNQNAIDMKKFICKIYKMCLETEADNHPKNYLKPFTPLEKGEMYQVFSDYPKVVIDLQAEHVNAVRMEELELLNEQSRLANARLEHEREQVKYLCKQVQDSQIHEIEKQYKKAIAKEEKRVADQRHRVMIMRKELRQREKQLLEDTRQQILHQNAEKRRIQLEALLTEIDRTRVRQDMDVKEAEDELCERYEDLLEQKKQLQLQLKLTDENGIYPRLEYSALEQQYKHLSEELSKVRLEASSVHNRRKQKLLNWLATAEDLLQSIELQMAEEMGKCQEELFSAQDDIDVKELETKTSCLERDIEKLLNELVGKKLTDSKEIREILKENIVDQSDVNNKQVISKQSLEKQPLKHSVDCKISSSTPSLGTTERNVPLNHSLSELQDPPFSHLKLTYNHHSSSGGSSDFLGRTADFYRREQEAIKSCMDLRKTLLSSWK